MIDEESVLNNDHLNSLLSNLFREHGYKVTPTRMAVAKYMLGNKEHPSAQQIHRDLKKTLPSATITTIYNTLKFLQDLNFIVELDSINGQKRYDPNTKPHTHLVCGKCGKIQDWMDTSVPEVASKIYEDTGFVPDGSRFNITGYCKNCKDGMADVIEEISEGYPHRDR